MILNHQLPHLADLLMAAAHADGRADHDELKTVRAILCDALHTSYLPDSLQLRLHHFNPSRFNLIRTCQALQPKTSHDRRTILALIAEVIDADDVHDFHEDDFLHRVGSAIQADTEEYEDLTITIVDIQPITPPPAPKS